VERGGGGGGRGVGTANDAGLIRDSATNQSSSIMRWRVGNVCVTEMQED
jgi:hypothetical protein